MFAVLSPMRKALRPAAAILAAVWLSACDATMIPSAGGGASTGGPKIDPNKPIQVALLVPKSDPGAGPVAQALENATRLAISELKGAKVDLRVYDTAGNSSTAAAQAQRAVDEGAKIILGPLFGEAANAAGLAVADEGVNVLSFSNNPSIAGGNVFVLGPTFANTAQRLMKYAKGQGKDSVVIVHSDDVPGQFGKVAIQQAATSAGVQVLSSEAYTLSVEGVTAAAQSAGAVAKQAGAESIFITTDATNAAMPMLLSMLPENGAAPGSVQYIGLTRFDVRPDLFDLPGAEGAWFTLPNQAAQDAFNSRYAAAYGSAPHPLAGLAYDGVAAIGALAAQGRGDALTGAALTRSTGFTGVSGVFRLMSDGTNQRGLAVATVRNKQVVILDPAPSNFGGAGF
ncbi:penicillin-binding protein activator [Tropicibacter oceani]|uniref:Penicillin-binding protein activator n=1 Tax=Tropicibacter oceani TaxID=3058420 RepID=A0ABY8QL58_9RHOB|nr:penicillin-binding protein activator [Tropicibacter oceani]WGW05370.1 penicillin-binding protein activator [Tropicibacter oceani]